ncbi:MAG TPA: mandelate racemase/muconate lactonizing enzyme family protein [Mycobacteriales bacterium]|jgi:L-alanine-DL-glutamate epimerase-like enolase superfamily enzyme|nr:mandelate racemase/muconate lactonizing enzyme family protein [Mycobacteriales bacterium]
MRIDAVDFFYLSMPEVYDIGDGSQDMLLVRLSAGGFIGWGECEASPLTSIASLVCPMSHSACKPVLESVLGQNLGDVTDIARIAELVRRDSLDLLQVSHTLSGIEIAMWDLLGQKLQAPVYELLGHRTAYPKLAYASALFGDSPQETYEKARTVAAAGYRAAKFGWGGYGMGTVAEDADQIRAARDGLGAEPMLFVDAGTVWGEDVEAAVLRLPALEDCRVGWLEEPFVSGAFDAYRQLSTRSTVGLAAGEGAHDANMAKHLVDYANIGHIQIDTGRIGGIGPSALVAEYAAGRGVRFVNHTFTSHLALAASLQSFAWLRDAVLCEYPVEASALATDLTAERIRPDGNGEVRLPDAPGLGIRPVPEKIQQYLLEVEIRVEGKVLYRTPELVLGARETAQ